jgi:uncharacterized protein YbbK (DUF523 family)
MENSKIMVSACLLGVNCRYDGKAKPVDGLKRRLKGCRIIPFCPECLGELPVPRLPAEIQAGAGDAVLTGESRVLNRQGEDYTDQFIAGALRTLELYRGNQPRYVLLKANSPSCGVGRIYDGSFTGRLRPGDGVTAALLRREGAILFTEEEFKELKNFS